MRTSLFWIVASSLMFLLCSCFEQSNSASEEVKVVASDDKELASSDDRNADEDATDGESKSSSSKRRSSLTEDDGDSSSSEASKSSGSVANKSKCTGNLKPAGTYDCDKYSCADDSFLNHGLEYCEILDERDNNVYRVVSIGDQVWIAENLRYNLKGSMSYLYDENYDRKIGRFYNWTMALNMPENLCGARTNDCPVSEYPWQGLCPDGWHLPDTTEYNKLIQYAKKNGGVEDSGYFLLAKDAWENEKDVTDKFGFSAIPAGVYNPDLSVVNGDMKGFTGSGTHFWTSMREHNDPEYANLPFAFVMNNVNDWYMCGQVLPAVYSSVRCVLGQGVKTDLSYAEYDPSSVASSSSDYEKPAGSSAAASWEIKESGYYDCEEYDCVTTKYLNPNIEYGEFLDDRDNKVYKTVEINDQIWMAQNLNYKRPLITSYDERGCYDSKEVNCEAYGRLYTWIAAIDTNDRCGMGKECDVFGTLLPRRGICPEGWHLPDSSEFKDLLNYAASSVEDGNWYMGAAWNLHARGEWESGTTPEVYEQYVDTYGFSVVPAGTMNEWGDRNLLNMGSYSKIWTSSEYSVNEASTVFFSIGVTDGRVLLSRSNKDVRQSVRCIKD